MDELALWSALAEEVTRQISGRNTLACSRWLLELQGWLNWSFNVFSLLKPCLNLLYDKTAGKYVPDGRPLRLHKHGTLLGLYGSPVFKLPTPNLDSDQEVLKI